MHGSPCSPRRGRDVDIRRLPRTLIPFTEATPGLEKFWGHFRSPWQSLRIAIDHYPERGDQVVVLYRLEATARDELAVQREGANVLTFRNGVADADRRVWKLGGGSRSDGAVRTRLSYRLLSLRDTAGRCRRRTSSLSGGRTQTAPCSTQLPNGSIARSVRIWTSTSSAACRQTIRKASRCSGVEMELFGSSPAQRDLARMAVRA